MKRKVLFVVDERQMGGVSIVLQDLLQVLNYDKLDVDVLVLHDQGNMLSDIPQPVHLFFGTPFFQVIDASLKTIVKSYNFILIWKKIRLVFAMKTGRIESILRKERKKILSKDYDVEIAFKDGFCALFTGCGDTPKKIHWLHSSYAFDNPNVRYPKLFQKILPRFDHIIGVSNRVVKEFNDIYHLSDKVEMLPPIIDIDRIHKKMNEKSSIFFSDKTIHVVCVGRMHVVKGYDRLLKVLYQLNQQHLLVNFQLHIYGDGPLFDEIKQQVIKFGLVEIVHLEGLTNNPYKEIKVFDCLLLPSYSEAFGTVITESFLCGVPVVATRTSASEMSVKNEYGMIVDNSEEGIYMGLRTIIENQNQLQKWKENLKDYQYDNRKIIKRLEQLLLE